MIKPAYGVFKKLFNPAVPARWRQPNHDAEAYHRIPAFHAAAGSVGIYLLEEFFSGRRPVVLVAGLAGIAAAAFCFIYFFNRYHNALKES
jgi:hypothetical protein